MLCFDSKLLFFDTVVISLVYISECPEVQLLSYSDHHHDKI